MMTHQSAVLRRISQQGSVDLVKQLLQTTGVDVNTAQEEDGCTALWLAAEAGHVAVCQLLCNKGANVEATKQPGSVTPLYVSAQNGHLGVVDTLLMNGANPNAPKSNGSTPLHIASQQGYVDVCKVLIRFGARHSPRNVQGVTPLHIAAFQGNEKIIRLLLNVGADPYTESQGKSTIDWANANGHGEVVQSVIDEFISEKNKSNNLRQNPEEANTLIGAMNDISAIPQQVTPTTTTKASGFATASNNIISTPTTTKLFNQQPFFDIISDDINGSQQQYNWYQSQFLKPAGDLSPNSANPTKFDENYSSQSRMSINARQPSSASTVGVLNKGTAGFAATHMALQKAIENEAVSNEKFRNATRQNPFAGATCHPLECYNDEKFKVTNAAAVSAISKNWSHFKKRLENCARNLNMTCGNVPDGWMYNADALQTYRNEALLVKAELQRAAEAQEQKAVKASVSNANAIGLDPEYLESLRQYLMEGSGAKGPIPASELHPAHIELELSLEPPSPSQFRAAVE